MPETHLHVELISHTPLPEQVCALGAKLCYAKADVNALRERVSSRDQSAFLERIMQSGHMSVLEHASFTFAVEGVSRALLAQLTRHRIASFSVQSQRYVSLAENFNYIRRWARKLPRATMHRCARCRHGMRSGSRSWARRGKAAMRTRALCCPMPARPA